MHPDELINQLKKHLQGYIIQNITTNSTTYPLPARALAPCCGRLVTGIRYLKPGNGIREAAHLPTACNPPTTGALFPANHLPTTCNSSVTGTLSPADRLPTASNSPTAGNPPVAGSPPVTGQIQILLEPPTLPDEPHALILPADSIQELRRRAFDLTLHFPRRRTLTFALTSKPIKDSRQEAEMESEVRREMLPCA